VLAPPSVIEDREKASLALAKQENTEQRLEPLVVAAADIPEPKPDLPAAKPVKPKQVAKVKKRDRPPTPDLRNAWAYTHSNGSTLPMFGGWFR
jgi:hypothetical protein